MNPPTIDTPASNGQVSPGLSFRQGTLQDVDFITQAILEAERSGTPRAMYESVFGLSEPEVRALLRAILDQDVPVCELCCGSFVLACDGPTPVGALATWVEGEEGPSNLLRATLLVEQLGTTRWAQAQAPLRLVAEVDIPRQAGTLQIESIFVPAAQRGRRITGAMIAYALAECRRTHPTVRRAQVLTVLENVASGNALRHAGFAVKSRASSQNPELGRWFPGSGRLLWERDL
ncbi:MAG: hypothetical protein ABSA52_08745 [Candidatus Binatia bacterium]|jgi:hypothetical protein